MSNCDSGDLEKALEFALESLKMAQKCKNKGSEAIACINVGSVSYKLGKPYEAIDYLTRGLKICQEIDDRFLEMKSLETLADAYSVLAYYEKALQCSQRHFDICLLYTSDAADE